MNQYFRRTFSLSEDIAVLTSIVEQDGTAAPIGENKLIISLVNIEQEVSVSRTPPVTSHATDKNIINNPPVHLNLYVMFSANFSGGNYEEALKFLSHTIYFFQKNPFFSHRTTPDLDPKISKLIMNIENLDVKDLSCLWSIISSKYIPSILYKVRMVSIDSHDIQSMVPAVGAIYQTTL